MKHFKDAMAKISPTMTPELSKAYEEILKEFRKRAVTKYDDDKTRYLG